MIFLFIREFIYKITICLQNYKLHIDNIVLSTSNVSSNASCIKPPDQCETMSLQEVVLRTVFEVTQHSHLMMYQVDYYYKSKRYCRTTKMSVENNLDPHRQALKRQRRPQVPASPLLPFMRQRSTKFACPHLQTWHGLAPNTETHLPSWMYTTLKSLLCSIWSVCRMYSMFITLVTYNMTRNFFHQPNMQLRYC